MGLLNFDARTVQPAMTLEPVPGGWYKVIIRKSNIKPTQKGDGGFLELQCEVVEGQHANRILYWNLNLFNPSEAAVEIARKTLSAICHVIGRFDVQDQQIQDSATPMLHNVPFFVLVNVEQGTKGPINNMRGCKDLNGNDPGKQAMGAAPAAPMGAPAGPQWAQAAPAAAPAAAPIPTAWQQSPQGQPQGWAASPASGQSAPGGFTPNVPLGQPAAPQTAAGQPWQAGTNTQPMAAPAQQQPQWQQNQAPQQTAPAPQQPQAPQWSGQPTQAAAPAAPQQQWTQGAPPANAPWQR